MSGTVPVGIKRKTSRAEDSREKLTSQERSKTVSGGKKGVDFITIKHKDDKEDFRVGDCILVQSEKKNMPYVGRIVSFSNYSWDLKHTRVEVSWFYRPEECKAGRMEFHGEKELFMSKHTDFIDADTISQKCLVMPISQFMELETVDDDEFYARFTYEPVTNTFSPETVPVYCLCEMPYNPDIYMISCTSCEDWFHPRCLGTTKSQLKKFDNKPWLCPDCSAERKWQIASLAESGNSTGTDT